MSKSRRSQFESQLKALQDDISNLSHKFSGPSVATEDVTRRRSDSDSPVQTDMKSKDAKNGGTGISQGTALASAKGQLAALRREVEVMGSNRDDAINEKMLAEKQRDEYRAAAVELSKLKV